MARHRFGDGRYRYFDHPLPDTIGALREGSTPSGADRQRWAELLRGDEPTFPARRTPSCWSAAAPPGQSGPTPLILRYGEGDWNALHQDLYGDVYFPFQVLTVLSDPAPTSRAASSCCSSSARARRAARTCQAARGAFVIFPTRHRPNAGRTATTVSGCATASAPSRAAGAPRSA